MCVGDYKSGLSLFCDFPEPTSQYRNLSALDTKYRIYPFFHIFEKLFTHTTFIATNAHVFVILIKLIFTLFVLSRWRLSIEPARPRQQWFAIILYDANSTCEKVSKSFCKRVYSTVRTFFTAAVDSLCMSYRMPLFVGLSRVIAPQSQWRLESDGGNFLSARRREQSLTYGI